MRKLALVILFLGFTSVALAYGHTWLKLSESIVTNNYGGQVKQCIWRCNQYGHNGHTTITQGNSPYVCPMPN